MYTKTATLNNYVKGPATGLDYFVTNGLILIDIDERDAIAWIARGEARYPSQTEIETINGQTARLNK